MNIRKSLIYSYLDRYASLAIGIASSMVTARLLTPEDIGVFSVTVVLLSYLATVRDMGAGGYLVQEKDLTPDRVRAVWAVQLGIGVFLSVVVLLISAPVANFYAEPRMRDIMLVVALNYAINPFGSLTYAWQMRVMRYDALALVRFSSTLAGTLVALYLAWRGMGPISLAYGSLATTTVNATMAIYFRPKWFPWLPGLKEIRRVLGFGSRTTGASMIGTILGSAPELLLGKLQGMTATGLYSRANGLVMMFYRLVMDGVTSVAVSWFAKESREHGSIAQPFLKATSYVTALGWAFSAGLVFLAHPAMRVLYGDQWDGAVDLTRLLAGALACGMPAVLSVPALLAIGDAKQVLRGTAITTAFSLILITIGAFAGLLPMAACLVLASTLRTWIWLQTTQKVLLFKWSDLMSRLRESAVVGIAAGVAPALAFVLYGPTPENIWLPLVIGVPGAGAGFIIAIILIKHPLLEEWQSIKMKLGYQ